MRPTSDARCRLIPLQTVTDSRGTLVVVENRTRIPFRIARIFYVSVRKKGTVRGNHAHKTLQELIICLNGRIAVETRTRRSRKVFRLSDPTVGLYLPPRVWSVQRTLSDRALYLVLASKKYQESDYIRDWAAYLAHPRASHAR